MVTEARIAEPGVTDQLDAWLSIIYNAITEKQVHLLDTSHLFLDISGDSGSCNYYFADHTRRTVFWLHTLDTVGVPPQHSLINSHLRMFINPFTLPSGLRIHAQNMLWRKIIGFMSNCSPKPRLNILCRP